MSTLTFVTADQNLPTARRLRARRHGVLIVDVAASGRPDRKDVADAILAGYGKDPDLDAATKLGWPLAVGWLEATPPRFAVLLEGDLLGPTLLAEVIDLFTICNVDLWVCAGDTNETRHLIDALGGRTATLDDLHQQLRDCAASADRAPTADVGRLPRSEVLAFRARTRALLDSEAFAAFDAHMRTLIDDITAALDAITVRNTTRAFAQHLRRLLYGTGTIDEALCVARAAQVVGIRHGWHIAVSTPDLIGAAATTPRLGLADVEGWWDALAAYRDPDPGAVAAMYHHGIHPQDLPGLTVDDVTITGGIDTGVTVTSGTGEPVVIDGPGAAYVHALRASRLAAGAGPGDRLFVTHRADEVTFKYVKRLVRTPVTDFGITSGPAQVPRQHPGAVEDLVRWGLRLDKLTKDPGANAA